MKPQEAEGLLAAYLLNELDGPTRGEVDAALAGDATLRERLADLRLTLKLLHQGLAEEEAPRLSDARREQLMRVVSSPLKVHTAKPRRWWRIAIPASVAAAAAVVLVGVLVTWLEKREACAPATALVADKYIAADSEVPREKYGRLPAEGQSPEKPGAVTLAHSGSDSNTTGATVLSGGGGDRVQEVTMNWRGGRDSEGEKLSVSGVVIRPATPGEQPARETTEGEARIAKSAGSGSASNAVARPTPDYMQNSTLGVDGSAVTAGNARLHVGGAETSGGDARVAKSAGSGSASNAVARPTDGDRTVNIGGAVTFNGTGTWDNWDEGRASHDAYRGSTTVAGGTPALNQPPPPSPAEPLPSIKKSGDDYAEISGNASGSGGLTRAGAGKLILSPGIDRLSSTGDDLGHKTGREDALTESRNGDGQLVLSGGNSLARTSSGTSKDFAYKGSGGFGAYGGDLRVDLNGHGSGDGKDKVTLVDDIDLGSAYRSVTVQAGTRAGSSQGSDNGNAVITLNSKVLTNGTFFGNKLSPVSGGVYGSNGSFSRRLTQGGDSPSVPSPISGPSVTLLNGAATNIGNITLNGGTVTGTAGGTVDATSGTWTEATKPEGRPAAGQPAEGKASNSLLAESPAAGPASNTVARPTTAKLREGDTDASKEGITMDGADRKSEGKFNVSGIAIPSREEDRQSLVLPVHNGDARAVADALNEVKRELQEERGASPSGRSHESTVVADASGKAVIVHGDSQTLERAKQIVKSLDVPANNEVARRTSQPAEEKEAESALPPASSFREAAVNPWVMTQQDRYSTFASDVDTASYSLCRSYLRAGYLPPRGAVRMEEFINAFDYNYPRRSGGVFSVFAEAAASPFAAAGDNLALLKVGVQARVVGREGRKAAHLVFVIDASGSMAQADRLPLVQQSLRMLVEAMNPADRVTLIAYSRAPSMYLECVPASEKEKVLSAVGSLRAGGPTNLLSGLEAGYELARREFKAGQINRVILCTDGAANLGQTDAKAILDRVGASRRDGITLTVAGFGRGGYNDELLETLAKQGDGGYVFIDRLQQARSTFVDKMTATLQTVAFDSKIQVEFNPQRVRRYRLIGYEKRQIADQDFRNDAVDAAEVGSGQSATALYELELLPAPAGRGEEDLGTVHVRYRDADTREVQEISHRLEAGVFRPMTVQGNPRFYLAAGAAQFAEILRESPHAKGNLKQVQSVIERVCQSLPLDDQAGELLSLVRKAQGLPKAP